MKRLAFCPLLLALSLHYGICCGEQGIRLETLPSDAQDITCTGDLQCNSSDTFCIGGEIETAEFPVLVPTDIKAKTVKRCDDKGCRLCVQVTMEMSVAFISEFSDELGSGDCADYDYDDLEYSEEDDELTNVSLFIRVDKPSNDSLLCANLFILREFPASYFCPLVRVSLPHSSIPRRTGTDNSIKVGSIVYNTVNAIPGNELNITSYTYPKYKEELNVHHNLPGCREIDQEENIVECEAPTLEFDGIDNVSVGVAQGTSARNITLRVYYKSKYDGNDTLHTLYGDQRYIVPKSDIVPCLCFQAWYSDIVNVADAVRNECCPFTNHSEEKVLRDSVFSVTIKDNMALYNLLAPCNLSAELSLCWKPGDPSACHEIPHTRKEILSQQIGSLKLEHPHPSLCLQVSVKGKVLHTSCLPESRQKRNEDTVLVLKHDLKSTSFCFVGQNKTITLKEATEQMRRGAEFLEQKIVGDIITEECVRIFQLDENREFYACNVAKYIRSRWNWSRVLCLLAIACVLLVLLLKNENLIKWLKAMTAEKSPREIFNNRSVLILYSPDDEEYEVLVRIFASSLKDLQLDVVLDQWHRIDMSKIGPLPWYHKQKSKVLEKNGLIILLFSEGARKRYIAYQAQDATQHRDPDPYQSFGAVLNCVQSDFCNQKAKGRYLVATFSPSCPDVVPEPFTSVPIYELPLRLEKLLKEIAGVNVKKLGRKQAKRLSNTIRERLSGKDKPKLTGSVAVELQPLVQSPSKVS
ncbi:interleukin-17 receptor C [Bufo bufo]|uniref:interleukin-17 receptor C n=1 Tax=Bufo bufo TaxID=8384 RepID=UPI001ABE7D4E|nr:interleukin-17 receptor C [Bufo bufo]